MDAVIVKKKAQDGYQFTELNETDVQGLTTAQLEFFSNYFQIRASDVMNPYISHDVRKGKKNCGHHPGQAMVPDRLVVPQQIECLHVKQPMHCNEVVQAVWGETEMQDGNRLEAVRQ